MVTSRSPRGFDKENAPTRHRKRLALRLNKTNGFCSLGPSNFRVAAWCTSFIGPAPGCTTVEPPTCHSHDSFLDHRTSATPSNLLRFLIRLSINLYVCEPLQATIIKDSCRHGSFSYTTISMRYLCTTNHALTAAVRLLCKRIRGATRD